MLVDIRLVLWLNWSICLIAATKKDPLSIEIKILNWGLFFCLSTVEDDLIVDQVDSPEIIDDFELGQDEAVDIKDKEVNKQKLSRRIAQYKVGSQLFICQDSLHHFWWKFWDSINLFFQ